jgi:hypothetical protein
MLTMKKQILPRTGNYYGMSIVPTYGAGTTTWVEGEMMNTDYGQFRRRGIVIHAGTQELVMVRLDVPDTFFSIPATTRAEHGYVTTNAKGEFEFRPHTTQTVSPAQFRKDTKHAYK